MIDTVYSSSGSYADPAPLGTDSLALLRLLADGAFHRGPTLASVLGCSRATVARALRELGCYGLEIEGVPGSGYRLPGGFDLIEPARVHAALGAWADRVAELRIRDCLDSTSAELRRRLAQGARAPIVCIAEYQSHGRGRRGRVWQSRFGAGIWMSILERTDPDPLLAAKLSLVIGVAVARVLCEVGVEGLGLKWPNDILVGEHKLGGILVESEIAGSGARMIMLGIGINTAPGVGAPPAAGYRATDLQSVLAPRPRPRRDLLAGRLAAALLEALHCYRAQGWQPFADDWARFDTVRGREVVVVLPNGERVHGRALGIDPDGALRIARGGSEIRCLAGEVSVRLRP